MSDTEPTQPGIGPYTYDRGSPQSRINSSGNDIASKLMSNLKNDDEQTKVRTPVRRSKRARERTSKIQAYLTERSAKKQVMLAKRSNVLSDAIKVKAQQGKPVWKIQSLSSKKHGKCRKMSTIRERMQMEKEVIESSRGHEDDIFGGKCVVFEGYENLLGRSSSSSSLSSLDTETRAVCSSRNGKSQAKRSTATTATPSAKRFTATATPSAASTPASNRTASTDSEDEFRMQASSYSDQAYIQMRLRDRELFDKLPVHRARNPRDQMGDQKETFSTLLQTVGKLERLNKRVEKTEQNYLRQSIGLSQDSSDEEEESSNHSDTD